MDPVSRDTPASPVRSPEVHTRTAVESDNYAGTAPSKLSTSGITTWAKSLKIPQVAGKQENTSSEKSSFTRFTSGLASRLSPKAAQPDATSEGTSQATQSNFIGTFTKGLVDSSKSAVKAVQVKARHVVSQNKRRYQEGEFDLDMTYITENIIAMGFPAGDMSSGFFGYLEGFYRNHMEEVIKFFETHHKDKYKVYNLCSERLYDASLFEGKVAIFPFDDHNCPPIQLIISFCQSAYSWLKEDIENVVVVHCKAGMARTGLMISSLLLYLKFFPTAEESIDYYNQKRCIDSKGLVLPSQIRYVKYFERVLTYFNGEDQPGRRCMLRGIRLHECPYWIRPSVTISNHNGVLFDTRKHHRTKDLSPDEFWFSAPKKGVMVFALPGEPGLTELTGDFKIHFHDRQGDFYCWLNTTMIENRKMLTTHDLDGFHKRKLPSPGFQVEVVLVNYNGATPQTQSAANKSTENSGVSPASTNGAATATATATEAATSTNLIKDSARNETEDEVFSDKKSEETRTSESRQAKAASEAGRTDTTTEPSSENLAQSNQVANITHDTKQLSMEKTMPANDDAPKKESLEGSGAVHDDSNPVGEASEFKVMAADASVFSFGDEEDYESD